MQNDTGLSISVSARSSFSSFGDTSSVGDTSWKSCSPSRMISPGGFSRLNPPFAMDSYIEEYEDVLGDSWDFEDSSGYRKGGPKEARLKKVELLGAPKDLEGTVAIKVRVDPTKRVNTLLLELQRKLKGLSGFEDVYIPEDVEKSRPAKDYAVVRFATREDAEAAIEAIYRDLPAHSPASRLKEQVTTFTKNTAALGINNKVVGDISVVEKVVIPQDVEFSSCMARNGAPWTSCRELKYLAPHKGAAVLDHHAIKLLNLPRHLTPETIEAAFRPFGALADVRCPKPLQVNLRTNEPNVGVAFVRYHDKRDLDDALAALQAGRVVLDGFVLQGEHQRPNNWPTQTSRRYY